MCLLATWEAVSAVISTALISGALHACSTTSMHRKKKKTGDDDYVGNSIDYIFLQCSLIPTHGAEIASIYPTA